MEALIRPYETLCSQAVLDLYEDAGWTRYTQDPPALMAAIRQSWLVLGAWVDQQLVGLIRVVSDGASIIYIQDILVRKSHQRRGIGSQLLHEALRQCGQVRQVVLLTDDNPKTRGFYESNGFRSCDQGSLVGFVRFQK